MLCLNKFHLCPSSCALLSPWLQSFSVMGKCITCFTNTSVQLTDTHHPAPPFHLNSCPSNISWCLLPLVLSALRCLSTLCLTCRVQPLTSSLHQCRGQPHLTSRRCHRAAVRLLISLTVTHMGHGEGLTCWRYSNTTLWVEQTPLRAAHSFMSSECGLVGN